MKAFVLSIILLICLSIGLNSQNQSQEAVQYMDKLFDSFSEVKKGTWKYMKSIAGGKSMNIVDRNRENLLSALNEQKLLVEKEPGFNSDTELRDAVVEYLDMSYTVLNEDFDKILDMEEIAEQSYDLMEAYMTAKEKAGDKLHNAIDKLKEAEIKFTEKYNITLIETEGDDIDKKIRKTGKALKYYNKLYLIFFKCYKQEAYLVDAQNRNDVSSMEQNISTMNIFCEDALSEIKDIESFNGDVSLKSSLKQVIMFFHREAKDDFPQMVDFYLKKDDFERAEKLINSKKKKDLTEDDINNYNNAVQEYNSSAKKYNLLNKKVNDQREKYFNIWNSSVDKFLDKHAG